MAKDVRAAFERALGRLRELGAELVELDETLPDMEPIWKVINHTTWRARFDDLIRRDGQPHVARRWCARWPMAADWSGADYQRAMFQRTDLFRRVQRWFETADYLVTPTLSRTALPIDQDLFEPIEIDGVEVGRAAPQLVPLHHAVQHHRPSCPHAVLRLRPRGPADRPAVRRPLPRRGLGAARGGALRGERGLAVAMAASSVTEAAP